VSGCGWVAIVRQHASYSTPILTLLLAMRCVFLSVCLSICEYVHMYVFVYVFESTQKCGCVVCWWVWVGGNSETARLLLDANADIAARNKVCLCLCLCLSVDM